MDVLTATSIRLANDLRSYAKDLSEGNLNALLYHYHHWQRCGLPSATAHQQAVAQIHDEIAHNLTQLKQYQAMAVTQTGKPEAMITDLAHFACAFYARYDYHTLTAD